MTKKTADKVVPFSNGSQYGDWMGANCDRCKKNDTCDLQLALDTACFTDGMVSPENATRMGITAENNGRYCWPCGEWDPDPEQVPALKAAIESGEVDPG